MISIVRWLVDETIYDKIKLRKIIHNMLINERGKIMEYTDLENSFHDKEFDVHKYVPLSLANQDVRNQLNKERTDQNEKAIL